MLTKPFTTNKRTVNLHHICLPTCWVCIRLFITSLGWQRNPIASCRISSRGSWSTSCEEACGARAFTGIEKSSVSQPCFRPMYPRTRLAIFADASVGSSPWFLHESSESQWQMDFPVALCAVICDCAQACYGGVVTPHVWRRQVGNRGGPSRYHNVRALFPAFFSCFHPYLWDEPHNAELWPVFNTLSKHRCSIGLIYLATLGPPCMRLQQACMRLNPD